MWRRKQPFLGVLLVLLTGLGTALLCSSRGDEPASTAAKLPVPVFEKDIQPILKENCVRCHGERSTKGGLDLTSLAGLLRGSESGRILIPGNPGESVLYEMVHDGSMPPAKNDFLAREQVETIQGWIAAGAPAINPVVSDDTSVTHHDLRQVLRLRCTVCHCFRETAGWLDLR
jgi:uncharacterized membrane protein